MGGREARAVAETTGTPAEIEARIARRREDLAATLDEIAIRVHPKTIAGDARALAVETVDRAASRAFATVSRGLDGVRGQFVSPEGGPRLERVVPVALVAAAAVGVLVASSRRRRR
ncbi:DUF3618 domain-containing protein [Streptomyces sp. 6N223]|uniref:DUF3618 domain-containing protein n=1 Tax=Streptomyces sp. 6N223 TaxID=3457412 RepID=UPI003FD5A8CA